MTTEDTTLPQLDAVLAAADQAAPILRRMSPAQRAGLLRGAADALEGAADELVPIARAESHLPEARLRSEVARTCYQLRLFAEVAVDGEHVQAIIDHADPDWALGPRPDIRRAREPVGPVLVFAASNFPFAFSVAGGDTASALAAGCPVVVKTSPGHPALSLRVAEIVANAVRTAGAPEGTLATITGVEVGRAALVDDRIAAAAFTGSTAGGRALFDLANARPTPIPFYGELGSTNPVFVTRAAVEARGPSIVEGFVGSFTLGVGQFCTKPGVLFLPAGHGLDVELARAAGDAPAAEMLDHRLRARYDERLRAVTTDGAVRRLTVGTESDEAVAPSLLTTTAASVLADPGRILEECFGPVSLVVDYEGPAELLALAEAFGGTLTATIHAESSDDDVVAPLLDILRPRSGRILWNGWPTGVAVGWAMHHGGPYPATTAPLHTSVGATAIDRFLRPVCFQDVPDHLLPPALQDDNPLGIVRRIDGALLHPAERIGP